MGRLTGAKALELLGGGAAGAYTAKRYTDLVGSPQQYTDEMGVVQTTAGMSDEKKKDIQMRAAGVGALAVAGPAGLRRFLLKRKSRKLTKADLEGIDAAKGAVKKQLDTSYFLSPVRYKKKREFQEADQLQKQFRDVANKSVKDADDYIDSSLFGGARRSKNMGSERFMSTIFGGRKQYNQAVNKAGGRDNFYANLLRDRANTKGSV